MHLWPDIQGCTTGGGEGKEVIARRLVPVGLIRLHERQSVSSLEFGLESVLSCMVMTTMSDIFCNY